MNDELMKKLVDRFLLWPLPASVCSDLCVTIHGRTDRIGTNLLTAVEARAMLEFVLEPVRSAEALKRLTAIDQELDAASPAAPAVAPTVKTDADIRRDAKHDMSCFGAFARARPRRKP